MFMKNTRKNIKEYLKSWFELDTVEYRVLDQVTTMFILEKFNTAITASNLDEFYDCRLGGCIIIWIITNNALVCVWASISSKIIIWRANFCAKTLISTICTICFRQQFQNHWWNWNFARREGAEVADYFRYYFFRCLWCMTIIATFQFWWIIGLWCRYKNKRKGTKKWGKWKYLLFKFLKTFLVFEEWIEAKQSFFLPIEESVKICL
jgi:hypothetical protein